MSKALKIVLAFVVAWMFFFPLYFTFLPNAINSKMLIAVLGAVFIFIDQARKRSGVVLKQSLVWMVIISMIFSLVCYATTVINNTSTTDYTDYFISMLVWFSAAYASYFMIRYAHGNASVELIGKYIIALCVAQGVISFAFHVSPEVYGFFSRFFNVLEATSRSGQRLFGLGTSSDTGGIRYAASMIFIGYLMCLKKTQTKEKIVLTICFLVILILGNMMSRTTTVGALLMLLYVVYKSFRKREGEASLNPMAAMIIVSVSTLPLLFLFNRLFPQTQQLYQFAFEGFYSRMNTGEWSTSTTDILWDMWQIWPDNIKTWIIGDGLFVDPNNSSLFYMGTDVGYARFVFFCGITGLSVFAAFFVYLYKVLRKSLPEHSELLLLLLILVFAIWIKVSTDIFFIFALLLCVGLNEDDDSELVDL